ncbi:MAG: hypothetical protein ACMUIP_05610 [bacterium]
MQKKIVRIIVMYCCFYFIWIGTGLAAPEINIKIDKNKIIRGRSFTLGIIAHWEGEPNDFLIPAPIVNLPDTFELIDSHTKTNALSEGRMQIAFIYLVKAGKIGKYTLDSLKAEYIPQGEKEKYTKMLSPISIEVIPWNLFGLTYIWLMVLCGFVLLILCLIFCIRKRGRRLEKEKESAAEKKEMEQQIIDLLEKARQAKVVGEDLRFMEMIIKLKEKLQWNCKEEVNLLERIKYSEHKISKEDREYIYRDIEQALKKEEKLELC